MKIKSGKTTIEVAVEDLALTVRELKQQLAEITGFTDIKLIHAGKVLKDEDTIGVIPGGLNSKLTMMGSTAEAIESLKDRDVTNVNNKRIIDDLSTDAHTTLRASNPSSSGPKQHNPCKFQSIQVLPNLPNQEKAREILNALANDEGILAVMKKHKWSVGALCELYPEGYVGVSDVCVLGLNENHGQRILLRLRTDDLKGFRKILSIRKVLCHELAHNVHSEHDDNFYVLMRQVEREIVELDWKNGKGRSLSGQPQGEVYTPVTAPVAAPVAHRLGGSTDPLVQQLVPARYLAGTAAIMRLSAEEKEVEDGCASSKAGSSSSVRAAVQRSVSAGHASASADMVADGKMPAQNSVPVKEAPGPESPMGGVERDQGEKWDARESDNAIENGESNMNVVANIESAAVQSGRAEESGAAAYSVTEPEQQAAGQVATLPEFSAIQEAVLLGMDESIALSLSMESAAAPVEKQLALRDAVSTMLTHIDRTQAGSAEKVAALRACLKVLLQVLLNAKDSTDAKYRTVKKSNKVFQRDVAEVAGAVEVLQCAGFSSSAEALTLNRYDVGLLYVVSAMLQSAMATVDSVLATTR